MAKLALKSLVLTLLLLVGNHYYFESQKETASRKGVSWLINQAAATDSINRKNGFRLIYKVTRDDKLASQLLQIINNADVKRKSMLTNIDEGKKYSLADIEDIASNLVKEQCLGIDNSIQIARLKNIYLLNKSEIESQIKENPNSVIVTYYFLEKLKIVDRSLFNQVIENIKTQDVHDSLTIYGLTHIIFTKSNYFDQYLNKENHREEIDIFNRILSKYAKIDKLETSEVDWLSEIIISLKILGQEKNNDVNIISRKLMSMQNIDGSWGGEDVSDESRRHLTIVASLALMDFNKNLRATDGFCASKIR